MQFDSVVANPPYMGSKYYDNSLRQLVEANYKLAKGDLYTRLIVRNTTFTKAGGIVGMITIPNWMFLRPSKSAASGYLHSLLLKPFLTMGEVFLAPILAAAHLHFDIKH